MSIYVSKGDLADKLKSLTGYNGTKIKVEISDSKMELRCYWDGGSRDTYTAYDMKGGRQNLQVQDAPYPFYKGGETPVYIPSADKFLVRHSIFMGKDMGLTIYLHPASVLVGELPLNKPDISQNELFILSIVRSYKSFARQEYYKKGGFTVSEVEAYKQILFQKGWLNKAGAITVDGRNVVEAYDDLVRSYAFKYEFKKDIILEATV
jgi:hypothetical protein